MSDRSVPVPADEAKTIIEFLKDAAEYWADRDDEFAGEALRLRDNLRALLAVPAEPETPPTTPADVLMPPETLEQRLEADGRLWKLAFEEAGFKEARKVPNVGPLPHHVGCKCFLCARSVAPDEDGETDLAATQQWEMRSVTLSDTPDSSLPNIPFEDAEKQ